MKKGMKRILSIAIFISMYLSGNCNVNMISYIKTNAQCENHLAGHIEGLPDDYYATEQWAVNAISLPAVWDWTAITTTSASNIKIGVIDSGIHGTHPDLTDNINRELSKDFTGGNNPLTDINGHGTAVAGIIGAEGNNSGLGIAGVCWNTQLVSLKVYSGSEGISEQNVADAINYAETQNIPILNISLGFSNEYECIKNAIENYNGLIVCSAGNITTKFPNPNNDQASHYLSNYTTKYNNVISVGNSDVNDFVYSESHYGKTTVDLFAPGTGVWTTHKNGYYNKYTGTSLSAPYVTGVAALMLAQNPSLTPAQIKQHIIQNVDIVYNGEGNSVFENYCVSGGRLNAYKAIYASVDGLPAHTHNYNYTITNETHTKTCVGCEGVITQNHIWSYSSVNDAQHLGSCIHCGKEISQPHDWIYESIGSFYHNKVCKICNETVTEDHNLSLNAYGSTNHILNCSICNAQITQNHIWKYESIDFTTHSKQCDICSYQTNESHTFKYKFGDINNHIKYCTDCDYETTGKHIWIKQDSTTWYCKTCNFKTLLQPISPIASEPIKQELMLQAALSPTGIVEYNGVTLYFENGNCYLLVAEGADVQAELAKLYYDNILVLTE